VEEVGGGGEERQRQAEFAEAPPMSCTLWLAGRVLTRGVDRGRVLTHDFERSERLHVTITFAR
jgi:hypothetical protein